MFLWLACAYGYKTAAYIKTHDIRGKQTLVFFVSLIQSLSGFHWLKVMVQYTNVLQLQSIVGVTSVSDK
ncbi:hypothetical protein DIC78_07010 [Bacillus halotolerans]|nr:hypothetical protein DIC78_07010 [Bacillus halotolerans]